MDNKNTEAAAVAEIARQNVLPTIHQLHALFSGSPPFAVHRDGKIESLERLLPRPLAIAQKVLLTDVQSFITYVENFADTSTMVFAEENGNGLQLTALLDYHAVGQPARVQHMARLVLAHAEEWKRWSKLSGQLMTQAQMAHLMEDSCMDVVAPAAAEMLEIVKTLEATQNVEFKSALRLDNGDRDFGYTVATGAKAGANGSLTIPAFFALKIPVFVNDAPMEVGARFRWNIDGGQLRLGYELIRPDNAHASAVQKVYTVVENALDREVLRGDPRVTF